MAEQLDLKRATANTVQQFEEPNAGFTSAQLWGMGYGRSDLLPAWGTRARDRVLRDLYRRSYNSLVQGAISGLVKKIKATPWEISGKPRLARYFQDVLNAAEFGKGWGVFVEKILVDYLTQDFGALMEIQAPGRADRPPTGAVTGISHLDSLRCLATGNPEFPIVYYSRITGQAHKLHYSRVYRFIDMVDGEELAYDTGLCALSRMADVAEASILMQRYVVQKLDDMPPAGLLTFQGITAKQWQQARLSYDADRRVDGGGQWANTMVLLPADPDKAVNATITPFAATPEGFDYEKYTSNFINRIALALGVDRQELWELSGNGIGTGAQSEMLALKARGKAFADILSMFERALNLAVLPRELRFEFKFEDTEGDKQKAEIAKMHSEIAIALQPLIGRDNALQYLANNSKSLADVLLDGDGVLKLNDRDVPTTDNPPQVEAIATDTEPLGTETENAATLTSEAVAKAITWWPKAEGRKDYNETRQVFVGQVADLITAAISGDASRVPFRAGMLATINELGRQAFVDGMVNAGGSDVLSNSDNAMLNNWLAQQNAYVDSLTSSLFDDERTINDPTQAATLWANKTLQSAYDLGMEASGNDPLYEWRMGTTIEHCADCNRLNRQVHRLSEYKERNLLPRNDNLECKGFNCKCRLIRTNKPPRGSF